MFGVASISFCSTLPLYLAWLPSGTAAELYQTALTNLVRKDGEVRGDKHETAGLLSACVGGFYNST
jgi:hypothetical protein